jgi:DNA helicase HerA-like ATPase
MRFSRFHLPPGQSFGRRSGEDELHHDYNQPLPRAPLRPSEPATEARPKIAGHHEPGRSAQPAAGERRHDPIGNPARQPSTQPAEESAAGSGWRTVGGGPGGQSLIDQLAAEAEAAETRPATSWSDDPSPPDPDRADHASPAAPHPRPFDDDENDPADDLDDIAVTIGRVVSIRGSVVWGALFDDDDGTAGRAARMGALVSMRGPDSRVFGIVNALQRDGGGGGQQAERTIFEIQVLGEISTGTPQAKAAGFQRGVSSYPPLDAPVTTVSLRDLAAVYARPRASNVHVGRLRHNRKVPAFVLTDSLLGKHFAVLGTTGSGKSCAVTVILRSILDELPNGHVVLLDPHNEYASAFADRAELLNPSNLQLPYWLLSFEEIAHILIGGSGSGNETSFAQTAILKDAILRAKQAFVGEAEDDGHLTVDTPTPYRLSDLIAALREGMGALNKADGSAPYLALIARIEGLRNDRRYAFMFASLAVRDNMRQILAQLLRIPVAGKPITIIDISGVPSEIVDVVVSVLFRLVFELAVWSDRGAGPPVLLVCEEAHRYVPENDTVNFAPTKRVISRIAKEGRKYGVTLCLVSQRPSELSMGSLAQCNTVFALRLTNEHDQAFVARALPDNARWLVDSLPSLNTQEAVVVGDGVTVPVHIRFNDLDRDHRPSSSNPSFAESWRNETDQTFLERAINRWRLQTR